MSSVKFIKNTFLVILFIAVVIIVILIDRSNIISYYTFPSTIDSTFPQQVRNIINNSGLNKRYTIKEVNNPSDAIITIKLTLRKDLDKYHIPPEYYPNGKQIRFSITYQSLQTKPKIFIDDQNWLNGVAESNLNLSDYRKYVILHEFMHGLSFDHQPCDDTTATNGVCPILFQSTRGCPAGYKCGSNITPVDFTKKLESCYL